MQGTRAVVADTVRLKGQATLLNRNTLPPPAFRWEYNVVHSIYESVDEFREHGACSFNGVRGGSTTGVDHFKHLQYESRLIITFRGHTAVAASSIRLCTADQPLLE